jgi:flagellar protein FliJ
MARGKFRLANVLRLRRIEEDVARARVGEAARGAHAADVAAEERAGALRTRLAAALGGQRPGRTFVAEREEDQRHAVAVRASWAASAAAHELHRQRMAELVEASQRVAALEKLEERVRQQREAKRRDAEARELDDIVTSRRPRDEA